MFFLSLKKWAKQMVDIDTSWIVSIVFGGIGGAVAGAVALYLLRRHEKKRDEEARVKNLREYLYTEISQKFRQVVFGPVGNRGGQ